MINLKKLLAIGVPPADAVNWLQDAELAVDYALSQCTEPEVIIYVSLPAAYMHAVLAQREKVTPPDPLDLLHAQFDQDATWSITYETMGNASERVYLASPLDRSGSKSLDGAEFLVARRHFESVDKGKARTEVSQKLVHALRLYWRDEENAYCRIDKNGDIEPVIRVIDLEDQADWGTVVTINARDLARYIAVTNTALVTKFDFTRVRSGYFGSWTDSVHKTRGQDCFYTAVTQSNASYANGFFVCRPKLTQDDLVRAERFTTDDEAKEYATFKAYDWKHKKIDELSCSPNALASYLEPHSPLPFQITPAFFRPEVLQRYKADPEKYSLQSRSISSRAGWYLQTYDVNEAGQVHTYLRYLGYLPYEEQLYWKSFNEWPNGSISERAFKTDIQGKWTNIPDPLVELIASVRKLDQVPPDWWSPRGNDLLKTTHYPITTSPNEWGDSILALDQSLVEGFLAKAIRSRLQTLNRPYETSWGSLKLIQEVFIAQGSPEPEAIAAIEPLRQLHFLRSKVKGHATQEHRQGLIRKARTEHGSLKKHFLQLSFDCQKAFSQACSRLETDTLSANCELP